MTKDLASLLKSGKNWSRIKTGAPGVFLLKIPPKKSAPARLAVEITPVDGTGTPTKERGLILKSTQDLDTYLEICHQLQFPMELQKLESLLKEIDGASSK